MTQTEKVKLSVSKKAKHIKEIAEETCILEPNVRRILGEGTKNGIFTRVAKGVYVIKIGNKNIAIIEAGNAVSSLNRLSKIKFKADMVFLDIPYNTPATVGGNRGVNYKTISPKEFNLVIHFIEKILKDEFSPVVYMHSNAKSGIRKMSKYNSKLLKYGFKIVANGSYTKYQKDGVTRTRNMLGNIMEPEMITVYTMSGQIKKSIGDSELDFHLIRPSGYQTEKPCELLRDIINKTTCEDNMILDPFLGSGVSAEQALLCKRNVYGIEIDELLVNNSIIPRLLKVAA